MTTKKSNEMKFVKVRRIKDGKKDIPLTKEDLLKFADQDMKDNEKSKLPFNPSTYIKFDINNLPEKDSYTLADLEAAAEETNKTKNEEQELAKKDEIKKEDSITEIVDPIRKLLDFLKDQTKVKTLIDAKLEDIKKILEDSSLSEQDKCEKVYYLITNMTMNYIIMNYSDTVFNTLKTDNDKHIVSILKRMYDPDLTTDVFNKSKEACMEIYNNITSSKKELLNNMEKRIDKFSDTIEDYLGEEYFIEMGEYINTKAYGVEAHEYLEGYIKKYPYLEIIINDALEKIGECTMYLKNPEFMDNIPTEYLGMEDFYYTNPLDFTYAGIFGVISGGINRTVINKSEREIKDALIRLEVMQPDKDYKEVIEEIEQPEEEAEEKEIKEEKPKQELSEEDNKLFEKLFK